MYTEYHTIADVDFVMGATQGSLCLMDFAHSKGLARILGRIQKCLARAANSPTPTLVDTAADATIIARVCVQLGEYFAGERQQFDVPLKLLGTAFQLQVWQALQTISYGQCVSYRQLAQRIGRPLAVRAVAAANGANALPILVPCHRVIGSNGRLTGFGGGLKLKQRLLHIEGVGLVL